MPVTTTVYVPVGVLVDGAIVNTELPVDVRDTVLTLNEHTALAGQGDVAPRPSDTLPLKPFSELRLIVDVLDDPCATENEVGLAEIEKSDTLTVNVVAWLRVPSVPVTVTV